MDQFPALAEEMLTVFGAVISGARHNAIKAISPATTKMILKTVRESGETSENVHIAAIYCSAKSIQIFHEMPMDERQLDISLLIEQYQQILTALAAKDNVSLATMVEGVGMISKMLSRPRGSAPILDEESSAEQLQALLARHGMIETLLQVVREVRFDSDRKQTLLPVAIGRVSLLLRGCEAAKQRMAKMDGYSKLFEAVSEVGPPDSGTLKAILCMATHGTEQSGADWSTADPIVNIEPVSYLLRWMRETEYEDYDTQTWLAECLHRLCSSSVQNKMLCCQSGVLLQLIECLKTHTRLHHRTAVELLKLIESLGCHSIGPYELKQLITLLRPTKGESDEDKFPYRSHVIHVISSMARRDGYEACRRYFDIGRDSKGISIPAIREWQGPVSGFTFHCWLRLDNLNQRPDEPLRRRQLYSLYGSSGNGFEAFLTQEGVLVAAVAHKKEFLAVPLADNPLGDERWHCVGISHSLGKRPFGSSSLCVYVDGTKRLECSLKYPALNGEPVSYCQIGSPLHRGNVPALNVGEVKHSFKEGIMDAIKVGIPGVITLPGALKQGGGSNDPHVKWTLIGLEDQLWGRPTPLCGQLGAICCFQDAITSSQAKLLQLAGPNRSLLDFAGDAQESTELHSRYFLDDFTYCIK